MTKKLSWKDKYATAKNKTIKIRMFDGEIADIELKRLTGADEMAEAGLLMYEADKKIKGLAQPDGEDADIEKSLRAISEVQVVLSKVAKMVVVLDEADAKSMTDEDWVQFVRNCGGVGGKLRTALISTVGLITGVAGAEDLRF